MREKQIKKIKDTINKSNQFRYINIIDNKVKQLKHIGFIKKRSSSQLAHMLYKSHEMKKPNVQSL